MSHGVEGPEVAFNVARTSLAHYPPDMRANFARTIFITLLVLFLPFASIASTSWYRRWQASRLLACVKKFDLGATTEAQAKQALQPFS